MKDVILHAFDWHYRDIEDRAQQIATLGYGAVLFPPLLYSRSDAQGQAWWQRYQPKDYRILRSYLGNKSELLAAIDSLHAHGVKVYADIVFNHMANEARADHLNFPGEEALRDYREHRQAYEQDRLYGNLDDGLFSPWDFHKHQDILNWMDQHESTEYWLSGLPDLSVNDWVIDQQRTCLAALNTLGIDGYRIDAIKHMPYEHLRRVFETQDLSGKFLFGEALTTNDAEERVFLWPLFGNTSMSFYDFPLHETLRRSFSPSGTLKELVDPAAFGQALPKWRAVTFSVTHDIPNNDGFRSTLLDKQDEFLANVYLLARDGGLPLIYSDDNQSATVYPDDHNRWANTWQREDTAAMLRFHNAVQGLAQVSLYEDDRFIVFARGDRGLVAINKSGEWQHPRIATRQLRQGAYDCQIHGYRMYVSGEVFEFAIAPRQANLWLLAS